MKALVFSFKIISAIAIGLLLFAFSCGKDDDNNNEGKMWDPSWLIGTWEGTTPSAVTPFENTKIRIVFENYNLEQHDTVPGGENLVYAYSGTFIWDPDNRAWSMPFSHANWLTGYNNIIWDGMDAIGGYTMNNVSLRIGDTLQTDPWHSMDLDWGPFTDNSGNPPTYLDFYGDIEIEMGGTLFRADYPPDQTSTMIRLTKK